MGLLVMAGDGRAQIGTPPPCPAAVIDREVFLPYHRAIKFHLRFHVGAETFEARSIVKPTRHAGAAACTDAEVVDLLIAELVKERNEFWPR